MTRIVALAYDSIGGVAPITGLARRLRAAGHEVAVAAPERYASLVRDAELEYRWLPTDPQTASDTEAAQDYMTRPSTRSQLGLVSEMVEGMRPLGPALVTAAAGAELLLLSPVATVLGQHVAEGLNISAVGTYLLPLSPTRKFAPPVLTPRDLGATANRALGWSALLSESVYRSQVNDLRRELGLRPTTTRAAVRDRNRHLPVLYGYSPTVVPRPTDWHDGLRVTGYWWPHENPDRSPDPTLVDFLESGPPPVYVGFGSSGTGRGEELSEIVGTALRRAGVRGVVLSGWAGMRVETDDVITVDHVPFGWLFPRTAAVVHHAGAGTAAAGLAAGRPTVPVPGFVEQPFWADRLVRHGVAPGAVPQSEVDADRLAALIAAAVTEPGYRHRAEVLATALAAEDGEGAAVTALDELLGSTPSRCA